MAMRSKLMVGNWKMNGSLAANASLLSEVLAGMGGIGCRAAVCVPSPYLAQAQGLLSGSGLSLGAQDVSAHAVGAYTGEVSADMLRDFAVRYCLVGHSERRLYHGETDVLVAAKVQRALAVGITPIVCLGESLAEREAGHTEAVVKRQLAAVIHANGHCISEIVVAYEPVWAIGSLWRQHERCQCGQFVGPTRCGWWFDRWCGAQGVRVFDPLGNRFQLSRPPLFFELLGVSK